MSQTPVPLLEIRNARKVFTSAGSAFRKKREIAALEDFSLVIPEQPASITTIAGESGSGKTTLANLVLGFTGLSSGQILFRGRDISALKGNDFLSYRRNVQAIFQDPFAVYNPFYRVEHVFDLVMRHFQLAKDRAQRNAMIEEALNVVGLRGEEVLQKYPHQLSGGQRQRIMMARAYLIKPSLIVADEPVSMVDASLRASILDVMLRLKNEYSISFLYITHDLSTAYQVGDQIVILYQGIVAEQGHTTRVIDKPHHPYVKLLLDSVPSANPQEKWTTEIELPPDEELRISNTTGCRFYPRCSERMAVCLDRQPPLYRVAESEHVAACYMYWDEVNAE